MKAASAALINLLNTNSFVMADLFTITPKNSSSVLRYTDADIDLSYIGNTFSSKGPLISRTGTKLSKGVEVDTLTLTISADATHLINGVPFMAAALRGALDGAEVRLERAFMANWGAPIDGALIIFTGNVSDISGTRSELSIEIKSDLELLNIKMPRNITQPGCLNAVYDTNCAANKAALTVSGTVTAIGATSNWIGTGNAQASGWFDQGVIKFNTGPNAGVQRTVKAYSPGNFWFALPLPNMPQVGDTYSVYPGCDKTMATCSSKFANLPRFRGFPFIPAPETAL